MGFTRVLPRPVDVLDDEVIVSPELGSHFDSHWLQMLLAVDLLVFPRVRSVHRDFDSFDW